MRPNCLNLSPALWLLIASSTASAAMVEFELVTQPGSPALTAQQWNAALTELGVARLQIRSGRADDKIEIVSRQGRDGITYLVRGALTPRGELLVPGGRFGLNDRGRLAAWLTRLKNEGPPARPGEERPLGLPAELFGKVQADLRRPLDLPTRDVPRGQVLTGIGERLKLPLTGAALASPGLLPDEPVQDELLGLTYGTALACVLRPAGLAFEPRRTPAGKVEYAVVRLAEAEHPWPVGTESSDSPKDLVPELFEFLNAEIDGVSLAEVLDVLGPRLKVPLLLDHWALGQEEIDPDAIEVSYPSRRTFYSHVLRSVLSRAKLKHQLRVDEAGRPFIWITTVRPH